MKRFDMRALHAELDAQRRGRGLSWAELTTELRDGADGEASDGAE
jgi:hypothetical protein